MSGFYTYLWLRESGTPYYAGKGTGRRAFSSSAHGVHRPVDRVRILIQEFPSEEDAFEAEKFLIAYYGRKDLGTGCLRNLTDGGEGSVGAIRSEEFRRNLAERTRGNKYCLGIKQSQETRQKRANKLRGRKRPEEVVKRIADSQRGRKVSLETIQKMKDAAARIPFEVKSLRGRNARAKSPGHTQPHTEEARRKMSESQRNRPPRSPISEETRDRMRKAATEREALKRLRKEGI